MTDDLMTIDPQSPAIADADAEAEVRTGAQRKIGTENRSPLRAT